MLAPAYEVYRSVRNSAELGREIYKRLKVAAGRLPQYAILFDGNLPREFIVTCQRSPLLTCVFPRAIPESRATLF